MIQYSKIGWGDGNIDYISPGGQCIRPKGIMLPENVLLYEKTNQKSVKGLKTNRRYFLSSKYKSPV